MVLYTALMPYYHSRMALGLNDLRRVAHLGCFTFYLHQFSGLYAGISAIYVLLRNIACTL